MPLLGGWPERVSAGVGRDTSHAIGAFHGVYLVALFSAGAPAGRADPFDPGVVYIGCAPKATLHSRWSSFRAAARSGQGPHSGGNSFHAAHLGPAPDPEVVLRQTFLAGLPVYASDPSGRRASFRARLLESVLVDAVLAAAPAGPPYRLLNKP
jgi:hypothetical protein